jgi:hypothetical protein
MMCGKFTARAVGLILFIVAASAFSAEVKLYWDPSESEYVVSYKVYHASSDAEVTPLKWRLLSTTTNLMFVHTNLSPGLHRWFITAVNAFGMESERSPEVSLNLQKPLPPALPRSQTTGIASATLLRSTDLEHWKELYTWHEISTNDVAYFAIRLNGGAPQPDLESLAKSKANEAKK